VIMRYPGKRRQRGAVAVIVGLLSALVFFGLLGIAVDLPYLYSRKTELQNAADAAALAGAKELNQTAAGITNAVNVAMDTFEQNASGNLINGELIDADHIRFGPTPDGPWFTQGQAEASPAGKTFIQVNTGTRNQPVLFMRVQSGTTTVGTFGYAVAGWKLVPITPIGVCAIDTQRTNYYSLPGPPATTELLQYGFRHGMAYDVMKLGPLSGSSVPYLVNPVDTDPASCDPNHSSAEFTAPFVCIGSSSMILDAQGAGIALGNTGLSNVIVKALNSRFGRYTGSHGTNQCEPASAPPDVNIMQYCYSESGGTACSTAGGNVPRYQVDQGAYDLDPGNIAVWGDTTTGYQTAKLDPTTKKPLYNYSPSDAGSRTPNLAFRSTTSPNGPNNGVLWSYGPAYRYDAGGDNGVGTAFGKADANLQGQMYNNGSVMDYFGTGYPDSTTPKYPYWQDSGATFQAPPAIAGATPTRDRRVINLLIINCGATTGAGACGQQLPVLGVGKFFMQVMADPTGDKKIEAEYAGLVDVRNFSEIRLYR
jgi:hypothetical protein